MCVFRDIPRKIQACSKKCLRDRILTVGEKVEGDSDSEWGSFEASKPETMCHQTNPSSRLVVTTRDKNESMA